jgi:hypothetical protein
MIVMAVRALDGSVLPFTQLVTEADIGAGRIRIPSAGNVKQLLPTERCRIDLTINGKRITAAWDPRIGEDKERSGVVSVPRALLRELVWPGEVLRVYRRGERSFIGERGSKLRLQQWVTRHRDVLNLMLCHASSTLDDFLETNPKWISPLGHPEWTTTAASHPYAEFRSNFWSALGLSNPPPNPTFWPDLGPNWDGVAALEGPGGQRGVLLVEAKSHLTEPESSCAAKPEGGRHRIVSSLDATKRYVEAPQSADWLRGYYQFANRLAFLYYLRARRNVPAWLALVNFVGDGFDGSRSVFPSKRADWDDTNSAITGHLGLPDCHALRPYLVNVYPPADGPPDDTPVPLLPHS